MKSKNQIDQKELRRQKILSEPLLPLIVKMSVPTIVGMLIMVIYNLTDTFFVGLLNDKSMTAAIGVVFSFVSIIQAIGFWFGYGSGNIMSKKLGEQDEEEATIISSIGMAFSIISGFLIAIMSWIFISDLTKFIGGNASVNLFEFTTQYLKVIIISVPFSLYSITIYNQLRLCGNVKDGMIGLL
ncbi:MATE family efflux transporter [Fenollaria massiliensis]|uniref:MATE family efflux transporter n=2 Tax=Bacillota TaxID=1239 RepID=UPI0004B8BCD3